MSFICPKFIFLLIFLSQIIYYTPIPQSDAWEGPPDKRKTWQGMWGDRRQEMVFIGSELDALNVQEVLDACLLTDEEMLLGVDGWKATMGDVVLFGG